MKFKRQSTIVHIIENMNIHTHEELIAELKREGFNVTQATVSRDIKELGLIKVPSEDGGSVYSVPVTQNDGGGARFDVISDMIKNVVAALHTVVINTYPGMASAVAAALDSTMTEDILGSIAGDDVVLIITRSEEKASQLESKIREKYKIG